MVYRNRPIIVRVYRGFGSWRLQKQSKKEAEKMAAIGIASRSTSMRSIFRNATARNLISLKPRPSVPNPNFTSPRFNTTSRIEGSLPRFIRRELSTNQPFHSTIAAACLVSKLPSDVTSPEGRFANYLSPI